VNVDDYGVIDSNIGIQGAPFFTAGGVGNAAAALGGVSAVPEPASLGLLCLTAVTVLRHRRRRRAH
jgi:hypothetical protein